MGHCKLNCCVQINFFTYLVSGSSKDKDGKKKKRDKVAEAEPPKKKKKKPIGYIVDFI